MVHRGVRRECPECGKVLSDLWKHMRTVHGQYRRRAKIPKENVVGPDGNNVVTTSPTKSSTSEADVTPRTSLQMKSTPISNNNNVGKKVGTAVSKNKRKSSPPVKVKMSFNFSKSGKKTKLAKS